MAKLWRKPLDSLGKPPVVAHVFIDKQRCKGCGYCVEFCPRQVLQMSTELNPKGYLLAAVIDEAKCLACGFCEVICPEFALKVSQDSKPSD
jgi:2-oxoglutarate ferredoxin oxidoreductase subunit delta